MKMKLHEMSKVALATFLIFGILVFSNKAPSSSQVRFTEAEAQRILAGGPARGEMVANIVKNVKAGTLDCMIPIPPMNESLYFQFFLKDNIEGAKVCIAQCIEKGNCFKYLSSSQRTILHNAARSSPEILRMVLDDIPASHSWLDIGDLNGNTPLDIAATTVLNVSNVRLLRDAGTNLILKRPDGQTSLERVQSLLKEPGFDVSKKEKLKEIEKILSQGAVEKLK